MATHRCLSDIHLSTALQVLLVTGGYNGDFLESTEVLALPGGRWREAGALPSGREGLRGASLQGVLYLTGGSELATDTAEIPSWEPEAEQWELAGNMLHTRFFHSLTMLPLFAVASLCPHIGLE